MRFSRSAPALLVGAVVVVVTAMAALSHRLSSALTRDIEDGQFRLMRAIVATSLEGAANRALARAEMVAQLPTVQSALAARDRPRLLAETMPMFRAQRDRFGVDQMQFHLAPATSFLRLHAPMQFGEDLSSFRPMVVTVNRSQTPRAGLAIARGGPAIFGVVPVRDAAGQPAGSFEVGLEFGAVLDAMKSSFGIDGVVFIEERPLRQIATGLGGEVFADQNRVGRYLKYHATNWSLLQRLVGAGDLEALSAPARFHRDALGAPWGVLLVPLRNSAGDPLGVIAVAQDFSASRAAAGRALVWQCLLAAFAIVLLIGVIVLVLRGVLLAPLRAVSAKFAALAEGDATQPVEDPDALCAELKDLAAQHERLRARVDAEARP
jgi:methyl-accepting chemotaxis protein